MGNLSIPLKSVQLELQMGRAHRSHRLNRPGQWGILWVVLLISSYC